MAKVLISQKYPPMIDPSRTTLAYGDGALLRMNRELKEGNLLLRQRALRSFSDYLRDPEHICSSLREGMIFTLITLLSEKDVFCRQKATECLITFSNHAIGREAILENKVIKELFFRMYEDTDELVRRNMYNCIRTMSEFPIGASGIMEAKLVEQLVEKVKTETPDIKVLILDILYACMLLDTEIVLESGSMKTFTDLLMDEWAPIRARAAKDIMALSITLDGKNKAVEEKCMDYLVGNLIDKDPDVRCYAAGAIMTIGITTKGKYTAIGAEALMPLVELVDDGTSEVRMNALKALTCLAEAPEGREQLIRPATLRKIRVHLHDPVPGVAHAAKIAVNTIEWKP